MEIAWYRSRGVGRAVQIACYRSRGIDWAVRIARYRSRGIDRAAGLVCALYGKKRVRKKNISKNSKNMKEKCNHMCYR